MHTEDQYEIIHELYELISQDIHGVIEGRLAGSHPEIAGAVRYRLSEQFRFWENVG